MIVSIILHDITTIFMLNSVFGPVKYVDVIVLYVYTIYI